MKNIKIKSLELINFKGIKHKQFSDLDAENFIYGANGTGKTTLFDSFIWLLFGKDCEGRSDYEIKPLDQNNTTQSDISSIVNAVLDVSGEEVTLSRLYKENWSTIKGTDELVLKGNVTKFTFNEVPVSKKEYDAKISQLVDEKIFKLITNPYAFEALKWQEKRDVLIGIVGEVSDEEIYNSNEDFLLLQSKLTNKTLDEYDKQLKVSIKKSKEENEGIPSRIDEVFRSKPEPIDFEEIDTEINAKKELLKSIDSEIENASLSVQNVVDSNTKIQQQIQTLNAQKSSIEIELRSKAKQECFVDTSSIDALNSKLNNVKSMLQNSSNYHTSLVRTLNDYNQSIAALDADRNDLAAKYHTENAKEFDASKYTCTCPNCQTSFLIDEEPEKQFNLDKIAKIQTIVDQGNSIKAKIESYKAKIAETNQAIEKAKEEIATYQAEIAALEADITAAKSNLETPKNEEEVYQNLLLNSAQISKLNIEISTLHSSIQEVKQADVSELKSKKISIQNEIDALVLKLNNKVLIESADKRITELKSRQKELSQQIADLEKQLFIIEKFKRVKSESLEQSVNRLFKFVTIKLFDKQMNGSEVPTCQVLINGVPFGSANLASKINAGIDIINTLCKAHQVTAPIFVDNRESCTELIETPSQIINLIVSPGDKHLRLEKQNVEQLELA